jgi:hypothetical protein
MRLGVLAYVAAYVWLAMPTLLFTMLEDPTSRWQIVVFTAGCVTLTLTLLWLPPGCENRTLSRGGARAS